MPDFTGDYWYCDPYDQTTNIDGNVTIWAGFNSSAILDTDIATLTHYNWNETCANARLIAAAPDMYNLLGKAWDALPDDHPLRYDIDACLCHVEGSPVPGEEDNE